MNYQSSNFGGEGSWSENVKKSLKVEVSLKMSMIFLSFVHLYVVQKGEKKNCIYKLSSDDKSFSSLIKKRDTHALF